MNCIIVDDEIMARTSLEKFCKQTPNLKVLQVCESAEEALEQLKAHQVDLIFLDIEMPGMTGLELLEVLPYMPKVIFTTSNKEYAFEAFEYDVTDFLKKPIRLSRFELAVEKAINRVGKMNAALEASVQEEIYLREKKRIVRVPYNQIWYFENVGDYVKAFTDHGPLVFHFTIKMLETKLTNPRFLKVHRAFIVNMSKIQDIQENSLVIQDKVIPVSRAHKSAVMSAINLL
ncbi:MAG: LytTR family DNA-binding domain-containing protein [Flavobacteriales bacterium]|nr:LytTR family DNA-binding domain-containing protein [Flavobacteriales bacterium]